MLFSYILCIYVFGRASEFEGVFGELYTNIQIKSIPDGLLSGISTDLYLRRRGDGFSRRERSIISANGFGLGIFGWSLGRFRFYCNKHFEN